MSNMEHNQNVIIENKRLQRHKIAHILFHKIICLPFNSLPPFTLSCLYELSAVKYFCFLVSTGSMLQGGSQTSRLKLLHLLWSEKTNSLIIGYIHIYIYFMNMYKEEYSY